jgi:RNA polymerase-interacting CarD/CdnL/TRCF family regulator
MDHMLKGKTDDDYNADGSAKQQDNSKKRTYAAVIDIADVTKNITTEMKETNRLVKEKNRLAKQSQLIALAQHLGKNEILEDLLAPLSSSSD